MARLTDFDSAVLLPPDLTIAAIRQSIEYIERELPDLIDIYLEQANVFSAVVGIYGTKALDSASVYEKSRHTDTAQQRFPDLRHRNAGVTPSPEYSLESKATKRPWALQAHYDHPGWYIIWRYLVDLTEVIENDRPVIIWRVDLAFLQSRDWKYEKSGAGVRGGGRTHTFGVKSPAARFRECAVYQRSDIVLKAGKPIPRNGE